MEIVRAEKMGFCFGVKKAVDTCEELENNIKNRYILGMLVHNKDVMNRMIELGYKIILEEELLEKKDSLQKEDLVIIRAHGTTKEIYKILEEKEVKIEDATCIFVKKIREILVEREKNGDEIIFIGDKEHPEVKGIISFGKNINIFRDLEELKKFTINSEKQYSVLTQTTLNKEKFLLIKDYLEKNYSNVNIFDRICGATSERQEATKKLAQNVDVVIVVGDLKSSNSKKLLEVALIYNKNSYLVQNEDELDISQLKGKEKIGITAGASTPEEVIQKIEKKIRGSRNV